MSRPDANPDKSVSTDFGPNEKNFFYSFKARYPLAFFFENLQINHFVGPQNFLLSGFKIILYIML